MIFVVRVHSERRMLERTDSGQDLGLVGTEDIISGDFLLKG